MTSFCYDFIDIIIISFIMPVVNAKNRQAMPFNSDNSADDIQHHDIEDNDSKSDQIRS